MSLTDTPQSLSPLELEWMETRGPWDQLASQFLMTVGLSGQLNQHRFPVLLNKLEFSTGKEPPSRASRIFFQTDIAITVVHLLSSDKNLKDLPLVTD